jgi:hypothetical protein
LLLAALVASAPALAAPGADIVVVWAPGTSIQPIETVGHARGAAVIDRSPAPPATVETAAFLKRGIDAYEAIRLPEAQTALDQARDLADKTGAAGLTRTQLSDLFLYRGLVRVAQGDEASAWVELEEALIIFPSRTLDPSTYAPKVAALLARVQEDVAQKHPTAKLELVAPQGCSGLIDGEPVAGAVLRPTGGHFVRVECPDHEPYANRIDLTTLGSVIPATPKPYDAPSETEVLIQARAANAHAVIVVEVRADLATVRLIGIDGHERERRSATVTRGDLAPVAAIVDAMLAPPVVVHEPWYRSKWAWVAGAVIVTAAIVIPLTAVIAGDTGATSATVTPTFPGKGFTF